MVMGDEGGPLGAGGKPSTRALLSQTLTSRASWQVIVGVALSYYSIYLMNSALFPMFDGVLTYTRDISILFEAAVMSGLVVIGLSFPRLARPLFFDSLTLVLIVAGGALMAAGLALGAPVPLVVGACLAVTARGWSSVEVLLAATRLPVASISVCLLSGGAIGYALQSVPMPPALGAVLGIALLPLAMMALCAPAARRAIDQTAASAPIVDLSVTRPASFLPLTDHVYTFQFVMYLAFGFALRFGEQEGSPAFGVLLVGAAVVALLAVSLARGGDMPLDGLYSLCVLLLLAGFLLVVAQVAQAAWKANTLLMVVSALCGLLINYTLVRLAVRNPVAALPIMCWGSVMSSAGTTIGALAGSVGNAWLEAGRQDAVSYLAGAVCLAIMAYQIFALHGYSFRATIRGVEPLPVEGISPAITAGEDFSVVCSELGTRYGLTRREQEVFEMLARGRDRERVEGVLGVSRNTVKAHVKHIYAKLGIHSHQELLDLVEGALDETRS